MGENSTPTIDATVRRLLADLRGRVIGSAAPDYETARTVYFSGMSRRPAAIVEAAGAEDVARVVTVAREAGVPLAVRSGGHSPAGHGGVDDGIVLDLSAMRGLEIDPAGRTAWAEAGLTAGAYTAAAGEHGLATGFGDTASVGIGGITLSGGIGFLHRKHGLTIDNVLAAEVVTADGERILADEASHPDLFWAIRGGGGNFGVVTRFRYRLHPVGDVLGGIMIFPATPERIADLLAVAAEAPEALSGLLNVTAAPPLPFIPAEHHGRPIIMALLVHAGPIDEGEQVLARLRRVASPLADLVRPMRYPQVFEGGEAPRPARMALRSFFVDEIDRVAAELVIDAIRNSTAPMRVAQFRVLGGAVARVPRDATAFAHRDRRMMALVAAGYARPEEAAAHDAWAARFAAELPKGEPGAYVGFMADEGEARVREAYPGAAWDRLAAVKTHYDPTNLFRLNQNVPPAKALAG